MAQLRVREKHEVDRRRDSGDFVAEAFKVYVTPTVQ